MSNGPATAQQAYDFLRGEIGRYFAYSREMKRDSTLAKVAHVEGLESLQAIGEFMCLSGLSEAGAWFLRRPRVQVEPADVVEVYANILDLLRDRCSETNIPLNESVPCGPFASLAERRCQFLARTLCGQDGKRFFADNQWPLLMGKPPAFLDRLYTAALEFHGLPLPRKPKPEQLEPTDSETTPAGKTLDKIATAIALKRKHPTWTNKRIAEQVPCAEKYLSSSAEYKAVAKAVKAIGWEDLRKASGNRGRNLDAYEG